MPELPSPCSLGTAYRAQLRSVMGRIGFASILTALTVTFALLVYALAIRSRTLGGTPGQAMPYLVRAQMLGLVVAFLLPGQLWNGIPPRDRRALHALPIDRRTIELLRTAAGGTLLLGFLVPLYLLAIFLDLRLGGGAGFAFRPSSWLLAIGAPTTLYLLGSVLGLRTASATGNMVRVIAWGGALMLGMIALGESVPALGRLAEAIQATLLSGSVGLFTALGSGIRSAATNAPTVGGLALTIWFSGAAALAVRSAGRAR